MSSVHCVQAYLEFLLEAHVVRMMRRRCFLGSRVFLRPVARFVRDGHIPLSLPCRTSLLGLGNLYSHLLSEALDFGQNHSPHLWHFLYYLESKVKCRGACRLVRGIMPYVEVLVFKCIFDGYPRRGVECEHMVEKVQSIRVRRGKHGRECLFRTVWEVSNVLLGAW